MANKSAAFSSKIRNLNEYYNNIVNCSLPVVNTGTDIANTLKYFSQTLLSVLKDISEEEEGQDNASGAVGQSLTATASASGVSAMATTAPSENTLNVEGGNLAPPSPRLGSSVAHTPHDASNATGFDPNEVKSTPLLGLVDSSNTLGFILNQTVSTLARDDDKTYSTRMKKFPNLNYTTLYHSLMNIIEIIPSIQVNQIAVGQSLIHTFGCLAPFLTEDLIDTLPYTIAFTLTTFPRELHKHIMDLLCNTLLPIAIYSNQSEESYLMNSIPSIIMIVLQYGCDSAFYAQLFECLLSLKRNLIQDIFCSIAYGSYKVRYHATNLLFHYWPKLNPNKSDRNIHYHFTIRKTIICQSEKCLDKKNTANRVCIDPSYAIHGAKTPPPYYVCNECYRDIPKKFQAYCHNIVQPVEDVSIYCENRSNCKAVDREKLAYVTCYSSPCITLNQNKPITFCKDCHSSKHQRLKNRSDHVFQCYIDSIWNLETKMRLYLSSSIVNLLKEVPIIESKKSLEMENTRAKAGAAAASAAAAAGNASLAPGGGAAGQQTAGGGQSNPTANFAGVLPTAKGDLTSLISVGLIGALNNNGTSNTSVLASNLFASGLSSEESNFNKRLLSRYGCYLIIALIKPNENEDLEIFGRIVSMVLEWFHLVCYIPSDASGELISKIRTNLILPWIKSVTEHHFELVVSCLLPFPPDFAKVGGIWETKSNKSSQIKEEFIKFCDLVPYEIITYEIWDYTMPFWIESIIYEVNDKHFVEFKNIFVKLFDPEMVLFKPELMYRFVIERFEGTSSPIQEQALTWLQILCELDVNIPMHLLVSMFHTGLNSLQKLESRALRRREALSSTVSGDSEIAQYNQNVLNNVNPFTVFDTYEAFRVYRNQLMLQQMTGQELAMLIKEEEEDFIINNSELNINCCIMMLDMIIKQFDIQKSPQHLGIFNPMSKELLLLMSKQLVLPWAKKHKCKQQFGFLSAESVSMPTSATGSVSTGSSNLNYCQFCEEYVLWFAFAKDILIYISPKQEVELSEINFSHLLEANFSPYLQSKSSAMAEQQQPGSPSRPGSPGATADEKGKDSASTPKKAESKTDPDLGIWVTSCGVYYFKFSHLSPHLQLLYSLLKELYRVPDVDAFYNLMVCLKQLIIHNDCLELANKEQKGFLIYCVEKMLVPSMWKLLSADYCHLNDLAVPLLIYSLLYESGRNAFWSLVDRDFKDPSWKVRMQAVSRCIAIAQNLKIKQIKANCNIFSSLSFAFSFLIFSINDIEPIVSQKAVTLLETLSDQALRSMLTCFELQFDCVISDRPFMIKLLTKLYTCLLATTKSQVTLTWEFFMQRFNTISIESQLLNNVLSPVDISGASSNNNFQRKINIARFALKRSDLVRPVSDDLSNFYTKISKINMALFKSKNKTDLSKQPSQCYEQAQAKADETENNEATSNQRADEAQNQEPSAAEPKSTDKRKASDERGPQNDHKQDEDDKQDEAQKAADIAKEQENLEKQILHSLITLLMKFMVNDDQSAVNEDRVMTKQQNVVLRHLYSLIKYNLSEHLFTVSPGLIRKSTPVNAFLSGLPMVLDRNFALGNNILVPVLRLLRYMPLPSIDENISIRVCQLQADAILPSYTIGLLSSQARHSWVLSLIIILYKYQYNWTNDNPNVSNLIKHLVQIVINTLNGLFHKCEITSFNPVKLNFNFAQSRFDNRDGFSQKSIHSTSDNNNGHLYIPNQQDDTQSIKSANERVNRRIPAGNKFFKIKIRSKSSVINIENTMRSSKEIKKGIKVISSSQNRLNSSTRASKKKESEFETVLVDSSSNDYKMSKACPFSWRKFFRIQRSQTTTVKGRTSQAASLLNVTGFGENTMLGNKIPHASIMSNQTMNLGAGASGYLSKLNMQINRRSAVTKSSIDEELDSADEDQFISNLEMIMNSSDLFDGQYGLTYIKCCRCDARLEYYPEDSLGSLIVICSTIVHRELNLMAPFVLDMLTAIMRIASNKIYGWQTNSNFYLPGNYTSIARQFLRCTLHQLVNNKIFYQLFQINFDCVELLEALAVALNDFNELTSVAALRQIINDLNTEKSINMNVCMTILNNVAVYMDYLPLESQQSQWVLVIQELEALFRKLEPLMNKVYDYTCLFMIMGTLFKVSSISSNKNILEPFSKLLSFILQNCFFKSEHLIDICSLSNRAFTKDRDKQYLPRVIVNELVQSISVKVKCTDRNLLLILQFVVLDAGGNIYKSNIIEDENELYDPHYYIPTNAADCLKQHINEIIAFIGDIHSLTKVKQALRLDRHLQTCASEDSLGAQLKAGLSQFLALEFTELNKCKDRDSRSIVKYLPWLSNLPSNAQQGAKEFVDCIDHIRFLSWILIGSLIHSALTRNKGTVISYPIPINCGNYIGEHIFYILNGFAEHSKTSAIHMSSLFHSFILCQLWTMYCEQIHVTYDNENDSSALNAIMEFWNKITPGILQLLSQTKVDNDKYFKELADMVILHFLSLIEGLQEYNSIVLAKFFPMWVQVLFMGPLQGDQLKRAKQCLNHQPSTESQLNTSANYSVLIKCLQRLQYKIAMIEMQSSQAAQLYNS